MSAVEEGKHPAEVVGESGNIYGNVAVPDPELGEADHLVDEPVKEEVAS